jgi:hypothetical protein
MLAAKAAVAQQARYWLEPYAMKVARTVLRGGKPERAYLSQLFNSMVLEKPYHNLNFLIFNFFLIREALIKKITIYLFFITLVIIHY